MQELDDKLREKQRHIDKVTEYNKQYKADINSLRTRLDILLRTTRRTSPFVTPRDIHSAGSAQHEKVRPQLWNKTFALTCWLSPFLWRIYANMCWCCHQGVKELRKDVQRLQTENLNLQFQIHTLSQPPPSEEAATQSSQSMQDTSCQVILPPHRESQCCKYGTLRESFPWVHLKLGMNSGRCSWFCNINVMAQP